ncbi:hypothetical protein HMPREF9622_00828 [Cutibacterium modestum HL037PA3]|nr:hypothetical protein HMPREF9622_00828 [Cutibacterium modestum HL037PA3]
MFVPSRYAAFILSHPKGVGEGMTAPILSFHYTWSRRNAPGWRRL